MMTDLMLDQLSDGQREFVEQLCAIAGLPPERWRLLSIRQDVEILALTRLADRLKRSHYRADARAVPRRERAWWLLAGDFLGLTAEEVQRVRNNRATRRLPHRDSGTRLGT